MRIALASIHPRPLSGQIEGLVGLGQALARQGHTVTIISAFPSEKLLGADRLQLATQPQRILLDQPSRISHVLMQLRRAAAQADVVQLNLPTPAFSVLADWLQSSVSVPVVVGYEAHLVRAFELLRRDRIGRSPDFYLPRLLINNSLLARLTLHRARCYVVHSQLQRDELVRLGISDDQIHVLPPVLPLDKFVHGSDAMRAQFAPGRIITYVGHYNHVKGVDVLLRAFQMLIPRIPDLYLALAWSGIGVDRMLAPLLSSAAFQGRVCQLGRVPVPDLLASSDLVVLPYRLTIGQAAFPAALIEALAAQVPVVTTDLPLLRELTEGGRTAKLAQPDDPVELARAIEHMLTHPSEVEQMRRAQRVWAQQNDPECVVKGYEQLYREIVAL